MSARLVQLREAIQRWYAGHQPRDRRIIAGVVVAIVASLVYVGVVEPIIDYRRGVGETIAEGQEALERAARFVARSDQLRAERDDLERRVAQARTRLLPGDSGTLGAATLQEKTNTTATAKGITVQSTQVMKEEVREPFRKVAVRLTLSGELKPFADFVSALEFEQHLSIPFVEVNRRGFGSQSTQKGPRTLTATLEVNGFVRAAVPGAAAEGDAAESEGAEAPTDGAAAEGEPVVPDGAGEANP